MGWSVQTSGALLFGVVVGWVAYRTLRRSAGSGLSDIATVIGAIGGAAITGLFPAETDLFGYYCIGLALGFFGYVATALFLAPSGQKNLEWLGDAPGSSSSGRSGWPADRDRRRCGGRRR